MVLALLSATAFVASAGGAAQSIVVTTTIPSSTTLVTTGCPPNTAGVTNFGTVLPGSVAKTQSDCTVSFGSSNDSSSLRMVQSDGSGTAMSQSAGTWTRHAGSAGRIFNIDGSANVIWAGSANGRVYRSTDSGATWSTKDVNGAGAANLGSVSTPSTSDAWLAGDGEVWRTTQSDQACAVAATACWTNVTVDGARAVAATSSTTAWTAGAWSISPTGAADPGNAFLDTNLYMTTDGGTSWTPQASPLAAANLGAIRSFDADTLVAWSTASTGLVGTHDGGTTWRNLNPPEYLNDVWAFSDTTMLAVGNGGGIYRTTNAMAATPTWTRISSGATDDLVRIRCSATICVVVGELGVQLRSTDNGLTWVAEDAATNVNLGGLARIGATTYVAGGAGDNLYVTTNDGTDWTQTRTGSHSWVDFTVAPGTTRAWRIGFDGLIERSTDNGVNWTTQVAASTTAPELLGIHAFDEQRVLAVGHDGTIRRTTDGGSTWTTVTSPVASALNAVDGTASGFAWIAGSGGVVLGSGDYGATWTVQFTQSGRDFRDVMAFSETSAVVTGGGHASPYGIAARTTDGRTWAAFSPPNNGSMVNDADAADGSLVGTLLINGGLYRTTDGGLTWTTAAPAGTYNSPIAIGMADTSTVFIGGIGSLRKSTDNGATSTGINVNFHHVLAIAAYDRSRIVSGGDGGTVGTTNIAGTVPDYALNSSDFHDDGTEAFGACLRATTGTPTWTPNATCDQTADGAHWRPIPTVADATAEVASTSVGDGVRIANFRFGLRVAPNEPPGELTAGITFVLVAPDV